MISGIGVPHARHRHAHGGFRNLLLRPQKVDFGGFRKLGYLIFLGGILKIRILLFRVLY